MVSVKLEAEDGGADLEDDSGFSLPLPDTIVCLSLVKSIEIVAIIKLGVEVAKAHKNPVMVLSALESAMKNS